MSIQGKWRIIEMPDYEPDFLDMMGPAYILFDKTGGEFAFGCVTGAIHGTVEGVAVEFTWYGNDEMDEACGDGWAELQADGTLEGQICFHSGDEAAFIAKPGRLLQQPVKDIDAHVASFVAWRGLSPCVFCAASPVTACISPQIEDAAAEQGAAQSEAGRYKKFANHPGNMRAAEIVQSVGRHKLRG